MTESVGGAEAKGFNQSDWPVYAASTFAIAVTYLPRLPVFQAHFQEVQEEIIQVNTIYYAVDGSDQILTDS